MSVYTDFGYDTIDLANLSGGLHLVHGGSYDRHVGEYVRACLSKARD